MHDGLLLVQETGYQNPRDNTSQSQYLYQLEMFVQALKYTHKNFKRFRKHWGILGYKSLELLQT